LISGFNGWRACIWLGCVVGAFEKMHFYGQRPVRKVIRRPVYYVTPHHYFAIFSIVKTRAFAADLKQSDASVRIQTGYQ
jgi:hypothetical protein